MHDRKHHFNYIHKPQSRQAFLSFSSLFSAIFHLFLLSTACTHPFCGFLPLTIFIHFLIHIVIHIFSASSVYPQNVDNMWITFPIYSHSFSTFSKKSLFFNGFRPVDSVFFLCTLLTFHVFHIRTPPIPPHYPHSFFHILTSLIFCYLFNIYLKSLLIYNSYDILIHITTYFSSEIFIRFPPAFFNFSLLKNRFYYIIQIIIHFFAYD